MTTPSSGNPISFSDIISEFGPSSPVSGLPNKSDLGSYRVSQTIAGKTWTLDSGVPTSGSISFANLQGKTLNIVIDSGTGDYDGLGVDLTNYWNSKVKTCVGNFKSPESTLSGQGAKKYHVVLRRDHGGTTYSGYWPSGSSLNVYVSGGATIWGDGAGGGGGGWSNGGGGGGGGYGGDGIQFSYSSNLIIDSGSAIFPGCGGGGGGGGNHHNPDPGPFDPTYRGGDGGHGRGLGYSGDYRTRGSDGGGGQGSSVGRAGGGGGGGGWSYDTRGYSGGRGASDGSNVGWGGGGGGGGAGGGPGGGPGRAIVRSAGVTVNVDNKGLCYPTDVPQLG